MKRIVLYPSPGMGHLIAMVEFGKFVLSRRPSLSVTVLTATFPFNTGSTAEYIAEVSSSVPSITFHRLPFVSPLRDLSSYTNGEHLTLDILRLCKPHVHDALRSLSLSSAVSAFIIDMFCTQTLPGAASLGIPTYFFYTCSASYLLVALRLPILHRTTTESFRHLHGTIFQVPGLPPFPATSMPLPLLDRNTEVYDEIVEIAAMMPNADGIIVNTFTSLEPKAVQALASEINIGDMPTPAIYCTGPLIMSSDKSGGAGGGSGMHECLTWLDSQPSRRVVFLCFGSLGVFSAEQLKEIATGLEISGQRFLWVVRSPPTGDRSKRFSPPPDPDLDLLLPNGFLDRTKDRGMVVKSWAPQVAVLSHESVGGFVTHCGWNSVLEAVCAGVPMVAWPLYAGQRFNKIMLVEEMKVALPINESEGGFVNSAEVAGRVKQIIDSAEGEEVRKRVVEMSNEAKVALSEAGSSRVALAKLFEQWKRTTA
ncbi:hypothetical protein Nepgr_021476 [Nepenthes gracilis]|uniref:Glycosyltransferase n=1 Tax=Nepenthes gracilis TaxID=150966 RepID=A0AAD3XX90_NEPGR|nr:hypothetical protein Nepgr_021476 [Nepenthes gracilis]